jgi:hypothetical protein
MDENNVTKILNAKTGIEYVPLPTRESMFTAVKRGVTGIMRGHHEWEPDDGANSDKVRLHSQQLAKIAETKGLNSDAKLERRRAFFGKLVKSRKATTSFVTRLSVRPHGTRLPLNGFS